MKSREMYLKKVLLHAMISFQLTKIVSTSSILTTPESSIGFLNTYRKDESFSKWDPLL